MRLFLLICLVPATTLAVGTQTAGDEVAMAALAGDDNGVLVWQSRRTGPMRIFARDLDGSDLRQLTPDVSMRDHTSPLISPDGTRVLYYETFMQTANTYYDDHTGDMMMINVDGSGVTTLVTDVRTYFECRFARWLDNDRVAYIAENHETWVYTVSTGAQSKLFAYPYAAFGAIPNQQLTYAIDGANRVFTINNPGPNGTLTEMQDYDGCEGNMSADGQWAYRVQASTHHFTRMSLDSWEEEGFFDNHNSRLPSSQDYIYFPQISSDQRFLALGASPNQHDHFASDYDIFVVRIDPVTFASQGDAVKFSFNDSLDSYPDIWVGPVAPADPELTSIVLTAPSGMVRAGDSLIVHASLKDQAGQPFSAAVTWSVSGGGSMSPANADAGAEHDASFISDGSEGTFTIEAASGGVSGSLPLVVYEVELPLRINCGANEYSAPGWQPDDPFVSDGADWTNPNAIDLSGVTNPAPAEVYRSVRHQIPHFYDFMVPDGRYRVRLHFADAYTDRSMDYTIEGQVMITELDIASEAGGVNRALIKEIEIAVADGDGLQIDVGGSGDDAFEAGIEIILLDAEPEPEPDPDPDPDPADVDGPEPALIGGCSAVGSPVALVGALVLLVFRRRRRSAQTIAQTRPPAR